MDYTEILHRAEAKVKEAEAVQTAVDAENRPISEAEELQINTLLEEATDLRKEADRKKRISEASASFETLQPRQTISETPVITPSPLIVPATARDHVEEGKMGFSHLGEFAMATYNAAHPEQRTWDDRLNPLMAATGASQGNQSSMGFAVPKTYSSKIWEGISSLGDNLLDLTDKYEVDGESLSIPANAETARTVGNRWGGVRGYWLSEAAAITASSPTIREVKVEPQELAVLCYATNKLLRNAKALDQYLTRAATEEINFLIGDSIINGDGTGKPLGILASGSLVSAAAEGSQTATTIHNSNIAKMWARMPARQRAEAVWLCNQDCDSQFDMMGKPVVTPASGASGGSEGLYNAEKDTLHGRPIIRTEWNATMGTVGDIILAYMKGYLSGVKGGVGTDQSIHLRFNFAETAFRFMFAVDGEPYLNSAVTPYKGSATQSHFIALATRS